MKRICICCANELRWFGKQPTPFLYCDNIECNRYGLITILFWKKSNDWKKIINKGEVDKELGENEIFEN